MYVSAGSFGAQSCWPVHAAPAGRPSLSASAHALPPPITTSSEFGATHTNASHASPLWQSRALKHPTAVIR
ncbi:MAG: hypothetical protein IT381_20800 [Deltaproteobacteria bacterium]|nr:hypothetical protein [Deltaproteobacteria bacterium]